MATSVEIRKRFLFAFGTALAARGFPQPRKSVRYGFFQKTIAGQIGIFVQPIRHGNEIRFSLRCGIRVDCVQEVMEKTELFAPEAVGETWSCGIMMVNLDKFSDWIAPLGPVRTGLAAFGLGPRKGGFKGWDDDYMFVDADDTIVAAKVERALGQVDTLGMPFLRQYGESTEAFLDLCLRDDDFADLCWLTFDHKILSGLVAARCLGRADAIKRLKQIALRKGGYYERLGNPEPLERIQRIGASLGLM